MYSFIVIAIYIYLCSNVSHLIIRHVFSGYVYTAKQLHSRKSFFLPRKKFYSIYRRKFLIEPTHIYKTHPIYKKKEPRRGSINLLERNKFISIESANRLVSSCFHFVNVNLNHCTACWHSDNVNHFTANTQLFSNSETN